MIVKISNTSMKMDVILRQLLVLDCDARLLLDCDVKVKVNMYVDKILYFYNIRHEDCITNYVISP